MTEYFEKTQRFSILGKRPDYFSHVRIQSDGYGVQWDENLTISYPVLYKMEKSVPPTADEQPIQGYTPVGV